MTDHPALFAALAAPFDSDEVKVRSQGGRQLSYVTARTVMNRLDNVVGPENWWDEYIPSEKSVLCRLTIRIEGNTLTKCDAGGFAGMQNEEDDEKSGYSDAFKRAAVKFGVGRYLYRDGVPSYVEGGARPEPQQAPPQQRPAQQRPQQSRSAPTTAPTQQRSSGGEAPKFTWPTPGKSVFAFVAKLGDHYGERLVDGVKAYAKKAGWDWRMDGWNQDQIDEVIADLVEYIKTLPNYKGELDSIPRPQSPLSKAKADLVSAINAQIVREGGTANDVEEMRRVVEMISAASANKHGHTGEVLSSIRECDDEVWLGNMRKELDAIAQVADDIPF